MIRLSTNEHPKYIVICTIFCLLFFSVLFFIIISFFLSLFCLFIYFASITTTRLVLFLFLFIKNSCNFLYTRLNYVTIIHVRRSFNESTHE
ncbi:uncharacterized protein B0P05DRAFT_556213 [Gilbertella persicaria]|uniref:uncharacterized protein n=1 Tax=Gilbertella persicaria TaxID=101096 RepID=UPI00221FE8CC|nr:uncharacterized protein B0P05DRAFT_556213 [Gilbertella persicaria]KAI8062813.1 hypothetical protein B0P05DRAFT_556213 [Gilbertella persicaria]